MQREDFCWCMLLLEIDEYFLVVWKLSEYSNKQNWMIHISGRCLRSVVSDAFTDAEKDAVRYTDMYIYIWYRLIGMRRRLTIRDLAKERGRRECWGSKSLHMTRLQSGCRNALPINSLIFFHIHSANYANPVSSDQVQTQLDGFNTGVAWKDTFGCVGKDEVCSLVKAFQSSLLRWMNAVSEWVRGVCMRVSRMG